MSIQNTDNLGIGGRLIVPIISSSIEKAMDESNSKIRPTNNDTGRGLGHPSLIIGKALQDNDEPSYHWGNISPLTPYRGVTDMKMKPPLRQHQRLEGRHKHLYISTHKT